jgi:hypothetical protein
VLTVEQMGGRITDDQLKIAFYGSQARAYPFIVRLCMQLNRRRDAFDYAERSRSKAFLDLREDSHVRIAGRSPAVSLTELRRRLLA